MFAWSTINASLILLGQMNAAAIQTVIIIYTKPKRSKKTAVHFSEVMKGTIKAS